MNPRVTAALAACLTVALVAPVRSDSAIFVDRAADAGLDMRHFNGMSGELYFVEMVGAGGALFDCDNDGDLDLYLVQGHMLGAGKTMADAIVDEPPPLPLRDRLFRNELVSAGGDGSLRFVDITAEAGIDARGYGMGVATGDIDNDGNTDLYVTNFGTNQLWRNLGGCRFEDATVATDTGDPAWSIATAFFDADRDGWLDLYVGNYVRYNLAENTNCPAKTGAPDYCGPLAFRPAPDRLFRNAGASRPFVDVTRSTGLTAAGNTLGVVTGDFDDDGRPDLYVANDGQPNQLWLQRPSPGGGENAALAFVDEAVLGGCAVNLDGVPEASMGVAAGDVDNDGDEDLFMTHLRNETNTVYINRGGGTFLDTSRTSGLGTPSWKHTGFGTAFLDYDNDGWLDVVAANGGVTLSGHESHRLSPPPPGQRLAWRLDEPNQLFRNQGDGRFEEATAEAGPAFAASTVSRGTVVGDVDNDGDPDIVVTNNHGPLQLLVNTVGQDRAWLGLRLVTGHEAPRDALGATATVARTDDTVLERRVRTDGSYASARDPRLRFGLGDDPAASHTVDVVWPDGQTESFTDVPTGRYTTLRQGDGTTAAPTESAATTPRR